MKQSSLGVILWDLKNGTLFVHDEWSFTVDFMTTHYSRKIAVKISNIMLMMVKMRAVEFMAISRSNLHLKGLQKSPVWINERNKQCPEYDGKPEN